jgi:hypothetical protein
MKPLLQYALVSFLATAIAFSTAPALAASQAPQNSAARIAQEDTLADQALEQMARAAVVQYGKADAPAALALQLAALTALCQGVDTATLARTASGKEPSLRLQTTNLQLIQVKHPLCKRLTSRAV